MLALPSPAAEPGDPKSPPSATAANPAALPAIPPDLIDPAFAGKIDLAEIRRAIGALDAQSLTAQAEKLLLAQRELGRKHKSLDFNGLIDLTLRVIAEKRDQDAFAVLEKTLARLSVGDFDAKLAATRPLLETTRKLPSPGPNVPLSETNSNAILHYNQCCNQIKTAKVIGDRKALDVMKKAFQGFADLHPKQKLHLLALIDDAIAALPPEFPAGAVALRELSAPLYMP